MSTLNSALLSIMLTVAHIGIESPGRAPLKAVRVPPKGFEVDTRQVLS